jgi:hypothetical protein
MRNGCMACPCGGRAIAYQASDCRGSYPSPLWGGWLPEGQSGGGKPRRKPCLWQTPTPASASGQCYASPPLAWPMRSIGVLFRDGGRRPPMPSPQGGRDRNFVTFQNHEGRKSLLQFRHRRLPCPAGDGLSRMEASGEVSPLRLVRKVSEFGHSASARSSNLSGVCCESQYFPWTAPRKGAAR